MQTVFHLITGDPGGQDTTLTLAENLADDEDVEMDDVVVLAQADGITPLTADGSHEDRVRSLQEKGIAFVACGNTLELRDLTREDLVDGVDVVDSGVTELTLLQSEGYAYIRP
ncbi:DsrE family protein [Halorarum halobium]|uniref:DsrE family protein n=1 Tax=Halorarum halobium TaxID=3075121 RepID=UPI0028A8A151|nr:DsrE family protein [Halobaculum sp. XH14]